MWLNLRDKIKAMLEANDLIQRVFEYETAEFNDDPVATIVASSNESDYRTTVANRRVYAFTVRLWVKRGGVRSEQQAENVLYELVDSVLDDFDRYYTLGTGSPGNALQLKTGYTMIKVEALPSAWFYTNRETLYRGAEISVRCVMDVDVTNIS